MYNFEKKLLRQENKKRKLKAFLGLLDSKDNDKNKPEELSSVSQKEEPLTDEEYKRAAKAVKVQLEKPEMSLKDAGEFSSLKLDSSVRSPIFMSDVRVLHTYAFNKSLAHPRWLKIKNWHRISQVILVIVEGVSIEDLQKASDAEITKQVEDACSSSESQNNDTDSENTSKENKTVKQSSEPESQNTATDKVNDTKESETLKSDPQWLLETLPRISSCLQHKVEMLAPSKYNEQPCTELLNVPVTQSTKNKLLKKFNSLSKAESKGLVYKALASVFTIQNAPDEVLKKKTREESVEIVDESGKTIKNFDKFDRRLLLLGPQSMCENSFPAPVPGCLGFGDPEYKFSKAKYTELTPESPMLGVDCEMCLTTTKQLELTSISIVDENLKLVYHTLVKPYNKIINYLTQYSGITPAMMKNVTKRLHHVHEDLRRLLPSDAILVGHSLNSDLKAMKLMHPYVIDSSLIYNLTHQRKRRSSLKLLTKMFLKKEIQQADKMGHDPTEDAGASLELVLHKLQHDLTYGDVIMGGKVADNVQEVNVDAEEEEETYKENQSLDKANFYAYSIFQISKELRGALVTTPSGYSHYEEVHSKAPETLPHIEIVEGNKQVSQKAADLCKGKDFVFFHMKMDNAIQKCETKKNFKDVFEKLDKRLARIYSNTNPRALVSVVVMGSSLDVPAEKRSNGIVMCDIKGEE